MIKYTREVLEPLVKKHISTANILRELNVSVVGGSTTHIGRVIKKLGLDTSHFKYGRNVASLPDFSDGQLEEIVKRHKSVAGILREVGCRTDGGCHKTLSKLLHDKNLDTSHFTGASWNKGQKMPIGKGNKKDPRSHLILRKERSRRTSGTLLKKYLLEIGRPNVCEYCGIESIWNFKELVFEVDHKNGKHWDDREENLALTCPNCHSQQPTSGIKNLVFSGRVGKMDIPTAF
jgi:HNH endonuclease